MKIPQAELLLIANTKTHDAIHMPASKGMMDRHVASLPKQPGSSR